MKKEIVFLLILLILANSYHSYTVDGTLRLYGGGTYFGALQIYYNGIWKYICDDGWNAEESLVACRQLGFSNYGSYRGSETTNFGYWLDNVVCTGNEEKIINCQNNGWGNHNCYSTKGIYLNCTGGPLVANTTTACIGEQITVNCTLNVPNAKDDFFSNLTNFIVGDSDIPKSQLTIEGTGFHGGVDLSKLTATAIGGTSKSVQGTITLISYTPADNGIRLGCSNDYYINGNTSNRGTVSESITVQQALPPSTPTINIVLSYLSPNNYNARIILSSPASFKTIDIYYIYRDDTLIAVTTNNEYTYADQLLVDTQYNYSVIANSCAGNSTQGIERITIEREGTLRLYGGGTSHGILQIYHNGRWGYICDDGWNREESLVACKQLGFSDYIYYRRAKITSGFFWLDDVICNGNEEKIIDCRDNGWGIHNCRSTEAISLSCSQAGTTRTEGSSPATIAFVVGPIVGCVPPIVIVIVAIICVVYLSRRKTARAQAPANILIGSTPTRTVRQIPDTIPLRDLNTKSNDTKETVYANNLGDDVIDLTFIDLPPPYEDIN